MQQNGYVRLPYFLCDDKWVKKPKTVSVLFHLVMRANWHEECRLPSYGVTLMPGELVTSRQRIMEWTGLTENEVRSALANLENAGRISCVSSRTNTKITLLFFGLSEDPLQKKEDAGKPEEDGLRPGEWIDEYGVLHY